MLPPSPTWIVVFAITVVEASRSRLPLIEEISTKPKSSKQTQCVFDNDLYDVGEKWKPTIEPFGVFYCILCECLAVRKKNRVLAKVHCRNFQTDCPKPNCDHPVLLPERCCKTCPGDTNNLEDVIARKKLEEESQKSFRKEFYAILSDGTRPVPRNLTNRAFLQMNKHRLSFIVQTNSIEKPTYVRFQDLEDTIVEEFVVYGNTTELSNYKVHGVWSKLPKIYRIMLRKGQLKVSLSYDSDTNRPSAYSGRIRKYDHKSTDLVADQYYFNLLSSGNSRAFAGMLNTSSFVLFEDKNDLARKAFSDESYHRRQNSVEKLKCYYEAQIYEEGAQWKNHHDDCEMCFCQKGRIKCESEICLKLACKEQIRIPGQCCSICKDEVTATNATQLDSCFFEGDKKHHLVGSKWHPYIPPFGFDRCATCMCTVGRKIHCERNKCPPLACSERVAFRANPMDCCKRCPNSMPIKSIMDQMSDQGFTDTIAIQQLKTQEILKSGGCRFRGSLYSNGDEWNPTVQPYGEIKCVVCRCKDGTHKCQRVDCPSMQHCRLVVTKNSQCCPICADNSHSTGRKRSNGKSRRSSFY